MMKTKIAVLAAVISMLTGCAMYSHTRTIVIGPVPEAYAVRTLTRKIAIKQIPYGTNRLFAGVVTNITEKTKLHTLFKKGEAALVTSHVIDGNYARDVGVQSLVAAGDPATIKATGGAAGTLAGEAGRAVMGVPPTGSAVEALKGILQK